LNIDPPAAEILKICGIARAAQALAPRVALSYQFKSIELLVSVHGFKGSGVQGYILVAGLHLGCVFTRKASALSG
jgi:hypothetical protein